MEHKVSYKTSDGVIREQYFDKFNEFADSMEEVAAQYYAGMKPEVSVETIYDNMIHKEKVTNAESSDTNGMEFLSEDSTITQE
jgi:hypothetical protein